MRLQDLSLSEKMWFLSLTMPGQFLRGKVQANMTTGDLNWSDEPARQWFEAELAKRRGQAPAQIPQQPPPPPPPQNPEAEFQAELAKIRSSTILTPAEKQQLEQRLIDHFYGRG